MGDNQVKITKSGFDALQTELDDLVKNKRPKLVDRLANARSEGDLKENSDYQNAREELEFMDGRIDELKVVINNAEIVSGKSNGSGVDVGTSVKVKVNGSENEFHIVGEWEANPAEKKISHTSPLGRALVGKNKGDKVEVEAPAGTLTYEILEIK